ncbi:MAG: amidohydrolase family protein, partial [Gemmatimonadota bacterium]
LDDPSLLQRLGMADVPSDGANPVRAVSALLQRAGWHAADIAAFRRGRARQDQFVREFRAAGGLVAAGTDAANPLLVPGASLHEELALLVSAGLTPIDAITAATRYGAQVLAADSLGMVAPGKAADLVVLNRNPADDITATRDIAWVMVRGRQIRPDSLRGGWSK